MKITRSALVITPTIAGDNLNKCALSIRNQTYNRENSVHHLFVVDGEEYAGDLNAMMAKTPGQAWSQQTHILQLPWNVGADMGSWYGHRAYASVPKLVPQKRFDYILFCDEDNWYHPEHVESCIDLIEQKNLDWSHSFRQIFDDSGYWLCDDNCEALGKYPIYGHKGNHLVDTSSFCFKYDFIRKNCHHWDHGWGGDRQFLAAVANKSKWDGTERHTLCYRLGGNDNSVKEAFFHTGNDIVFKQNGDKWPWTKT